MAILFIATISVMVKLKPKLAPNSESFTWRQRLESLRGIMGVVILFLFVFGGMFGGVFTVNEAAAAGAFLAMVFMAINRKLRWNSLMAVLRETVKSTSMVYLILLGATVLGNFLASSQLPSRLATYVGGMNVSATALMLIIVAIYFCLGCLMDGMAMILLTVPIFLPIIENFGINKIWFGVLVILMGQIGGITPPVGMSVYVIGGVVKDVPLQTIFRESLLLSSACCLRLS
jgi:tripartite ATP-independent transporter DctM subunit